MKTIEQLTSTIDTHDQLLKTFSLLEAAFIDETSTRKKRDLVTPDPETVHTAAGHVYSLRTLGTSQPPLLGRHMTELGEALNRISQSEGTPDMFTSQSHEERGRRIREFGTRTLALIDNDTSAPGAADTIVGTIRSSSTKVFDWQGRPAGYRHTITSPELLVSDTIRSERSESALSYNWLNLQLRHLYLAMMTAETTFLKRCLLATPTA